MLEPELVAAVASGATVITPNNRLARRLNTLHDRSQQALGKSAWPAAKILPWTAWLTELWLDLNAAPVISADGTAIPRLLSEREVGYLWRTVVTDAQIAGLPPIDVDGAAALAQDAWELMHAWGAGGQSFRAWLAAQGGDATLDQAIFARWAQDYHRELVRTVTCDRSTLPDICARHAPQVTNWQGRQFAFAGFLELTPAQQRLQSALASAGATIVNAAVTVAGKQPPQLAEGATAQDELRRALQWARRVVSADRDATVGIAVADLAERRNEVCTIAQEELCPELQWPGRELAPRPFSLSLGAPLSEVPIIATALDLLTLAHGPVATADAAVLMRSAYLPNAQRWSRRAAIARTWQDEGRGEIGWEGLIAALRAFDPELAQRFGALQMPPARGRQPMRHWIDVWRAWLVASGWPGDTTLSSPEMQARNAWEELCAEIAAVDRVGVAMTSRQAFAYLRVTVRRQVFQPEAADASIHIMGVLEAAGLPFDALWITGLNADTWPPAPSPNPLLPRQWQRERGVPRSSAARELDYARVLTRVLALGAPVVVMSYGALRNDHPSAPSLLMLDSTGDHRLPVPSPDLVAASAAASAPQWEVVDGDSAPPLLLGSKLRGGTGLIAAQSDCPFRATARYRLRADPWPVAQDGLRVMERGTLVHATLAHFWRATDTHAALAAMTQPELVAQVDHAVARAHDAIPAVRWAMLPAVVAAGEPIRQRDLTLQWLVDCELQRPAFTVGEIESAMTIELAGVILSLRLDRVDHPETGGALIIDYKTGQVALPKHWFAPRPRDPQLGLYALAWRDGASPLALRGVAYAQLKPGQVRAVGIRADDEAWPALEDVAAATRLPSWHAVGEWWRVHLPQLADEFRRGHATVTPRDNGAPCRTCGLQALCRIGEVRDADEETP